MDLTQATLKQWALNNGLNANISSMSQAEKAMLRYQYVMAQTTASQGDFAKTSGSWANQVRILAENFKALGSIVGNVLINAFKPVIQFLNKVVVAVTSAVETIANALGAIFGWTVEVSPGGQTLDDAASGLDNVGTSADNAGNSMGNAAKKAKKLKDAVMSFDELNKMPDPTSSLSGSGGSGGSGSGGSGGTGSSSAGTASLVKTDSIFEKYKSDIKSLEELGSWISDSLSKAMESIDWESIYDKARNFGTGLASFLNGLISPRLFGNVGRTIANGLNTALEFLNSFGETFDWKNLGESIGTGITSFFTNWKPKLAAETFNTWANGILDAMIKAMDTTDWKTIGRQIGIFLAGIDYKGLLAKIGRLIWEAIKAAVNVAKGMFGETAGNVEATIVAALLTLKFARIGYNFGYTVWSKITKAILGKSLTELKGKEIGDGVSKTITDQIEKSVEKSMPVASKTIGEKLWSGLEKVASSPFGQAATYTAIIQLGAEIQKFTDKLKGGNGQLSEMGGIFDSLSTYYTPEFSKKLFQLKERLEDQGASSDVVKEKMTNLFTAAGISADSLRTALNNVAGSGNVTAEQMDILQGIIDNLGNTSDSTSQKVENSGIKTSDAYQKMRDALILLQQDGIIPSQEHMDALNSVLDKQRSSGATAKTAMSALKTEMKNLSIYTNETDGIIDKKLNPILGNTKKRADEASNSVNVLSNSAFYNMSKNADEASGKSTTLFNTLGNFSVGKLLGIIGVNTLGTSMKGTGDKAQDANGKIDRLNTSFGQMSASNPIKQASALSEHLNSLKNTAEKVADGVKGKFDINLYSKGRDVASTFSKGLQSVHIKLPKVSLSTTSYIRGNTSYTETSSSLTWHRDGGFIRGEVWGMNEDGNPEMVGRVGNGVGKTAAANNEIIAEAIKGAVVEGMMQVFMNTGSQQPNGNGVTEITLRLENDEVLARAVLRGQQRLDYRNNPTPRFSY